MVTRPVCVRPVKDGPFHAKCRFHRSLRGLNNRTTRPVCVLTPEYSVPCSCCRRGKCNAPEANRHRPISPFPLVSVSAFLKLADWYQAYTFAIQGGEPCAGAKKDPFCGETGSESAAGAEPTLGSSSRGGSPAKPAGAQSIGCSAASPTSKQRGGGA